MGREAGRGFSYVDLALPEAHPSNLNLQSKKVADGKGTHEGKHVHREPLQKGVAKRVEERVNAERNARMFARAHKGKTELETRVGRIEALSSAGR